MKLKNKFAIGCLIQWYEIEMIEEYLQSVKNSVDFVDNKKNIVIDNPIIIIFFIYLV